jgi:hypothetical protein
VGQRKRRRAADRAIRPAMRSPGRPNVARREDRQQFWKSIARGLQSEDAAVECGVSPAVGTRWFRENGGMSPINLAPVSGRYLSLAERERRSPCSRRRTVAFETLPAGSAATRERSPESCAATPPPVAAGWSIGPRRRSGMPSGGPSVPRPRNSPRTRRCASTCSNGFPGGSRLQTAAWCPARGGAVDRAASRSPQEPALGAGMEP